MALSTSSFTTAEAAALAKDKPMLVGPNRLTSAHTVQWRTSGLWSSGSDGTDTAGPVSRTYDDHSHLLSFPTSSSVLYLLFDFGASGISFDTIAILNHNLPTGATITSVISDATNFASPTTVISMSGTVVAGRRVVVPLASRYASVRYARILFSSAVLPTVGEVVFGSRVQLDWRPDVPYDDQDLLTPSVRRTTTVGGIMHTTRLGPIGQRRIRARNLVDSPTVAANLLTMWKEHGGARPFLWIDNPSTAPHRANWVMLDDAAISRPYNDALNRDWSFDASEVGPHYTSLEP